MRLNRQEILARVLVYELPRQDFVQAEHAAVQRDFHDLTEDAILEFPYFGHDVRNLVLLQPQNLVAAVRQPHNRLVVCHNLI